MYSISDNKILYPEIDQFQLEFSKQILDYIKKSIFKRFFPPNYSKWKKMNESTFTEIQQLFIFVEERRKKMISNDSSLLNRMLLTKKEHKDNLKCTAYKPSMDMQITI